MSITSRQDDLEQRVKALEAQTLILQHMYDAGYDDGRKSITGPVGPQPAGRSLETRFRRNRVFRQPAAAQRARYLRAVRSE
jgi:hypothetical protein